MKEEILKVKDKIIAKYGHYMLSPKEAMQETLLNKQELKIAIKKTNDYYYALDVAEWIVKNYYKEEAAWI